MPSPFPGMDPYIEQDVIWHDFHERFLPAAAAQVSAQVLPRYIVLIDESVYLQDVEMMEDRPIGRPDITVARASEPKARVGLATGILEAPTRVRVPEIEQERESFLKIYDRTNRQVITVIELLSPTNKRRGENRRRYLAKRADLLNGSAHLVEIDLLRGGPPMPAEDRPECDYSVLVSRADERPSAGFWPIGLRDGLPNIPVPLLAGEPDARLDLRAVIDRVYDEAGYRYFLYDRVPEPPLAGSDYEWAAQMMADAASAGGPS
jgi:hypothetical protein